MHYLVNASAPEMCLNVAYERITVAGNLQQWDRTSNGGASELWTLVPTHIGSLLLVNRNSRLAASPASLEIGSCITQVDLLSEELAQWTIVTGRDTTRTLPRKPFGSKILRNLITSQE